LIDWLINWLIDWLIDCKLVCVASPLKSKDWLIRNQDNVSVWVDMSIRGLTLTDVVGSNTLAGLVKV
jgi:hypothetical protein